MSEEFESQDGSRFVRAMNFKQELSSRIAEASSRRREDPDADYISEPIGSYILIEDGIEYLVVVRIFGVNPIGMNYELAGIVSDISLKKISNPDSDIEELIKEKGGSDGDVEYIKELVQSYIVENIKELEEKAKVVERYKAEGGNSSLALASPSLAVTTQRSKELSRESGSVDPQNKPPSDNDWLWKILAAIGLLIFWYLVGAIGA